MKFEISELMQNISQNFNKKNYLDFGNLEFARYVAKFKHKNYSDFGNLDFRRYFAKLRYFAFQ